MDETANLKLPYILAAQSQKHVTHNEALRALDAIVQLAVADKDLSTPPGSPGEGARYIVGASPTGGWSGHATHIAAWQDGAWAFYVPVAGWLAWVDDESQTYLFSGGGWIPAPGGGGGSLVPKGAWSSATTYATGDLVEYESYVFASNIDGNVDNEPDAETPGSTAEWTYFSIVTGGGGGGGGEASVNPVSLVGVNATADASNRLSVASPASLFSHEGEGHQLKINKESASDTASVLFQTGFSGRAEFGLAGDDDFHVKVSADGSTWREAIVINRSSGAVRASGLREVLAANRTYYVRTDGSDSNTGLANTSGGAFATIQRAYDVICATLDLGGYTATVQLADGTYTAGLTITQPWTGGGAIIFKGNSGTPANVVISTTSASCFFNTASLPGLLTIQDMKLQTTTSGLGVRNDGVGAIAYANIDFGAMASGNAHLQADGTAAILKCAGNCRISGGGFAHMFVQNGGQIYERGVTITLSGTPAFAGAYAYAATGGILAVNANTYSGSATGPRFNVSDCAIISTGGGGANYLPGNSAGTGSNPSASPYGRYA